MSIKALGIRLSNLNFINNIDKAGQRYSSLLSNQEYEKLNFLRGDKKSISFATRIIGKDEFQTTEVTRGMHRRLIISKFDRSQEPVTTAVTTRTKDFLGDRLVKIHKDQIRYVNKSITGINFGRLSFFDFINNVVDTILK